MSAAQVDEVVETTTTDDGTRPPLAHGYCPKCNAGVEIAVSICGMGRKPRAELYLGDWPAGVQVCTVCADLEFKACPRCGR